MHICFISQEYPPETGWGGIGSYTHEMAHGLSRKGHEVTVIARAEAGEHITADGGVTVHRIRPAPEWQRVRGMWRLQRVWPGFAWAAACRLRSIHGRFPVDIVEAAEARGDSEFVPLLQRRIPTVVRLHTAWTFVDRLNHVSPTRLKQWVYWQERFAIQTARAVTSPSQAMVDLTESWVPLNRGRVYVVPNPVDVSTFSPGCEERREVVFVGRLERRKGISILAETLPNVLGRCPDVSFRFIGADSTDERGQSWRERLLEGVPVSERDRVHFARVSREDLVHYYRSAAVCIVPSIWENFPYSLLEAMACGTPTIVSAAGGLPEIVEDGVSGLLVPPADSSALCDAICSLLADRELREEMGQNARKSAVERFSVERVIPRMVETYRQILESI